MVIELDDEDDEFDLLTVFNFNNSQHQQHKNSIFHTANCIFKWKVGDDD